MQYDIKWDPINFNLVYCCRFPKCEDVVALDLLTRILDSRWKEINELREKVQLREFIQSVCLSAIAKIHKELLEKELEDKDRE